MGPAYGYVRNSPVTKGDDLGLDRYITQFDIADLGHSGGTQLHVGVAVDLWKVVNGKYVKDGEETYDFSIDWLTEDEESIDWLNFIAAFYKARGRLTVSSGLNLEAPIKFSSSPCQDLKMYELIQRDKASPPFYNSFAHNCIVWSVGAVNYGLDQPSIGRCCNPDGTIFRSEK